MNDSTNEVVTFNTLGNYAWPATPADESIRRFSWKIWRRFEKPKDDPFISNATLKWANKTRLDGIASPPACAPIIDEMQATFRDWVDDETPSRWLQLVVLPPYDTKNLVQSWAKTNGHHIIEPPGREQLLDRSADIPMSTSTTTFRW